MQIFTSLQDIPRASFATPVLTMGNFDGVHRGHQHLFRHIQQRAKAIQGTSIVLTFDPHPQKVLFPEKEFFQINQLDEKIAIIQKIGIDVLVCLPFTRTFATSPPLRFVREILVDSLRIREIYVGHDSRFGNAQEGTPEDLAAWGKQFGFTVTVVPPVLHDGETISSTKIRHYLRTGEVEKAGLFLDRPYAVDGRVVRGTHRGTTMLGYPTANVDVHHELIPRTGVYIGQVRWNDTLFPAVMNIGTNPTFQQDTKILVEVHLLDFCADLYGQHIKVLFHKRLRDELKFSTHQALMEQIARDVQAAQYFFQHQESLSET